MNNDAISAPKVSVIIGFKDWGLERLELSIKSIRESLALTPHEIIISDYGSIDSDSISAVAMRTGARHEKVETGGEWSRSRALNAGVRASNGEYILATDADMLFTPGALDRVISQLEQHANQIVILQCRDLPTGYSHDVVAREGFDWSRFSSIAQIRPRWGMGGLVGVHRSLWNELRGWDERMHTYGGEDIDFAKRAQYYGARINWLDEPGIAMYHIWHPSSGASAARSPEATAAIAHNRKIHSEDRTFSRNRVDSSYLPTDLPPIVSVIFHGDTRDHRSERTLASIASQSVRDIEVLVTDAAYCDERDSRIKQYDALETSPAGTFVAAIEPGDIWADDYLETLLTAWEPGVGLISGTSARQLLDDNGEPLAQLEPLQSDAPQVSATLIRASLLNNTSLDSRRNWVEAVRLTAASGASWRVVPEILQVHIDTLDTEEARANSWARENTQILATLQRCGLPAPQMPDPTRHALGPRANAALYGRAVALRAEVFGPTTEPVSFPHLAGAEHSVSTIETREGAIIRSVHVWTGGSLLDSIYAENQLKRQGIGASLTYEEQLPALIPASESSIHLARAGEEAYGDNGKDSLWLAVALEDSSYERTREQMLKTPSVAVVLDRIVSTNEQSTLWLLARLRHDSRAAAWQAAADFVRNGNVSLIELPAAHISSKETS